MEMQQWETRNNNYRYNLQNEGEKDEYRKCELR